MTMPPPPPGGFPDDSNQPPPGQQPAGDAYEQPAGGYGQPAGGYGQPPAYGGPNPYGAGGSTTKNNLGGWALGLGIASIACCGPAGVAAIILGRQSQTAAKQGHATNGGMGKAGFILGIIACALWSIGLIIGAATGFSLSSDDDADARGSSSSASQQGNGDDTATDRTSADETSQSQQDGPAESDDTEGSAPSRNNSSATATTLGAGTFAVGADVPAGRYTITTTTGSGNLFVRSEVRLRDVNEILGGDYGVPSVTVDLADGDEIEISGLSSVDFTPAETVLSDTLTAGQWVVGLDIAPGRYVATPAEGQSGNFFVYESGRSKVNEILGGDYGVADVSLTLKDGQDIKISGISSVTFSPK